LNFWLSKQGHGIRIEVHVTTNGNQDIDPVFLLAESDRLAIDKTAVQDEPLHHSWFHRFHELFEE